MSELDTALVLRMEASLAKFEKQMARAKKVGNDAAKDLEGRFANSNKKMARNAEASATAIGREMDRLRAKYDPLFAASKRYEAELTDLNRAHKLGALSATQYESALDRLNADYARLTAGAQRMAGAATTVTRTTRGMGGGIQNVAFQVGDFATQVGAGTSATVALGQQLPQLLGGFGALGAVLGAVVAIGVPLAAALFRNGEEAQTMKERIESLESAVNDYRAATQEAFIPTADLAKKYGTATAAARQFLTALREIANVDALKDIDDNIGQTLGQFGDAAGKSAQDFLGVMDRVAALRDKLGVGSNAQPIGMIDFGDASAEEIKAMFDELDRLEGYVQIVQRLGVEYGISARQAEQVAAALKQIDEADSTLAKVHATQRFIALLESTMGPYSAMTEEQKKLYDWANQSNRTMAEIVGLAGSAAGAIGGAASEAGRLADELGRAVQNAINLAAQGISDLRRAEIEWQFRDDPVGRAGALAGARVDEQAINALPADTPDFVRDQVLEDLQKQRAEIVANAEAAESMNQRLLEWRKAQAEAASSSSGGGSGGGLKGGIFTATDAQLTQAERQLEMLGKTRAEVAALTAKYQLLDEARKRGLDLDARQAATGETLREQIDRQAEAIGRLTAAHDAASDRAKFFESAQQSLTDGFLDAIVEGENLSGVLENLAKSLAKAALQAALFGTGPFGGDGGGLLGGLFDGIFASAKGNVISDGRPVTAFASGGVVNSPTYFPMRGNRTGLMGEAGPEAIMPLTRGANGKLGVQASGGGSTQVMFAPNIDARGADAGAVERLERALAQANAEFSGRVIQTISRARKAGVSV